jgi:tetratricopeptide (TPR) repeat protein
VQKAHYLLGRLLTQSGDKEEGKKELQASEVLMKENLSRDHDRLADYLGENTGMGSGAKVPPAVMEGGAMQVDLEAVQQAEMFQKQIGPAVADSYNNLGAMAGSQKNFDAALKYFERAAEWNPALEGLDVNLGRAAFAAGQFEQAVPPLKRYIRSHPEDKDIRSALGLSQFIVKDYPGVLVTLQPIAAAPDTAPRVAFAYAESLVQTGDVKSGVEQLTALERRDPDAAAIHRALGEALAIGSDMKAAVHELETAIRLNPQSAESYDALGRLQLKQGNTTAAITSLEEAVKLAPQSSAVHYDLAAAYRQASRPADAAREMQQYEKLRDAGTPGAS